MIEFILNGKSIKVAKEDVGAFLKGNPDARPKDPREFDADEYDIKKKMKEREQEQQVNLESPGKSQEAGQPQLPTMIKTEDTESSSESTSSDLVEYDLNDKLVKVNKQDVEAFEKGNPDAIAIPEEKQNWLTEVLGDNRSTRLVNEYVNAVHQGLSEGSEIDTAYKYFVKGKDMSQEEFDDLIKNYRELEKSGQSELLMQHHKRYGELVEENGAVLGFMKAWAENPETMLIANAQSNALILGSAWDNKLRTAAGGAGGYLSAKGINKLLTKIPGGKGKMLGAGWTALTGAYATTSYANEAAMTTLELVQEQYDIAYENQGKQWADTTDEERLEWYVRVANDEVLYDDLTNRAHKRGLSIAMIDGFTGLTVGAITKGVTSKMARSRFSGATALAGIATTAAVETGGGMVSEYVGQKAAGQETNMYEILMEGVADKTFTSAKIAKTVFTGGKNPKYTVNGEALNGREFDRVLRILDDEAFIMADIKIENSPKVEQAVTDRINAVLVDQTIDSRISDVNDRAELIKLKTRYEQIKDTSNKIELAQVETKIQEITNKYANSEVDIDVQNRKDAIAFALEGKIMDRYNSNLQFAKKNASLYGLEVDDTLTQDQIREQYGEEAAGSDGFIVGNKIIVNKAVAAETGAVNVANHELLHGILRKYMVDNPDAFVNIREQLKSQIGEKQWQYVEDRVTANYSKAYMQANPDEWITLTSDAIAAGEITYSESVFRPLADFIVPILRSLGFKKIKFNTGKDVFNFLKEYQRSIQKGKLSEGIVDATADPNVQVTDDIKFSRSNTQGVLDRFGGDARKMIRETLSKTKTGEPIDMAKGDTAFFDSEFGQEIMPIVNRITQRLYDPISPNAKRNVTKDQYKNSLISMAGTLVTNEFNAENLGPGQTIDDFISNRLNLRAESLAEQLGIESAEVTSKQDRIDDVYAGEQRQRQIEDTTQPESAFDTKDLSIAKQVQDKKGLFDVVPKGEFVKKIFKFDKATVSTPVRNLLKDINYDTDSLYEDVAADMVAQVDPKAGVRTDVKPTGMLYAPFEIISKTHFGVDPKSIMATQQTLGKPESISARTKIVDAIKRTKSAKGLSPVKRVISSVLPKVNFNPKSEKSIGINTKLLTELYVDGNMRVPNLAGKALNVDRMADTDILRVFGINPDLSLMPYNRTYDGAVKGFVKQASAFAINQETRDIVGLQDATIGIGRPEMTFSKSSKILDIRSLFELETKGIDKLFSAFAMDPTFNLRTENGREQFIQAIENSLLPLMPRNFWFGPDSTVFTASNKAYGLSLSTTDGKRKNANNEYKYPEQAKAYNDLRNRLKELRNLPDESFGQPIDGVTDFSISAYSTIFKDDATIRTNIKNGKIEEWNNKVAAIHRAMWTRFNEAIRNDNTENKIVTRTIGTYLKLTANDTGHWHKLGAQFTGHSPKLNKYRDSKGNIKQGKYEYEHAMPATAAYLYLMESALNSVSNFDAAYNKIIDNYKLIALDKAMDVKLVKAKLQRRMPKGWKVTDFWWQRYLNEVVGEIDGGIPANSIIMLDGKTMGQTFSVDRFGRTNKVKHKTTPKQQKYSLSSKKAVLNSFNQIAENAKKMNEAMRADLEKRGYTFVDKTEPIKTTFEKIVENRKTQNDIIQADLEARGYKFSKGMSTFDFDETLIIDGENFVVATDPNTGETQDVKSGDWPLLGPELADQGYTFNFDDFVNVRGGVDGPLLQKMKNQIAKYGSKNVFILTARPQTADTAIHGWLKSKGIDIPFKNITGLGDGRGEAKAQWMLDKFAEGYNDMYFVDDALPNVEAVKKVLDQLDIKSKVVQAKIKFSKTASENFNTILEESQGTNRSRTFSQAQARRMGKNKGWWRIFVPPSAEDFKGLLYRFLGTGRQGDMHMKYFKIKLLDPFAKGIRAWNIYKQEMVNEYKQLRKDMPYVVEIMNHQVEDTGFTVDDAIRVYLWDKNGHDIPGLDYDTEQMLVDYVNGEPDVKAFADTLSNITKTQQGYVSAGNNWSLGSIATDLNRVVDKIGRKEFLSEYLANAEAIFTPENMAKIEALYGTNFRSALENIMERMERGGNRKISSDKNVNRMYNWINGSIGAIMFFNMRSALLQTISTVNFINWSDNNIFKASAAFANQPQFWSDFATLFNSPQLKQRRKGIQIDVSASELSKAFSDGKGTPQSVISWLLEKGFTPTQIADSFAISFGGASFYRNRMKTYLNQGLSEFDANEKAMLDFQEIAEETQQSSREDLISGQQAGPLGRLILAFQNVTMQYTRLTKKAIGDLVNRRGDTKTNISKILYYGMVQNIVFAALQNALMFFIWGGDQEELEDKTQRTLNSALDSFLRGSGIFGAVVSTVKNTIIQHNKQKDKDWGREDGRTLLEIVNISPPIGSKLRKIYNAIKTEQYNKGVSEEIGFRVENPELYKWASVIEALTNIPTQRLVKKANNIEEAFTGDHEVWQRIHLALGWSTWQLGIEDEELEQAKKDAKSRSSSSNKKNKKEEKVERVRCSAMKKSGGRCKNKTKNKSGKCYAHQ